MLKRTLLRFALVFSVFSVAAGQPAQTTNTEEVTKRQARVIEIIPLSDADLIRIDGNYENNLAPGVVCTVGNGKTVKGEIIIIHSRLNTAYALITQFNGEGDILPGDRIQPKRSQSF